MSKFVPEFYTVKHCVASFKKYFIWICFTRIMKKKFYFALVLVIFATVFSLQQKALAGSGTETPTAEEKQKEIEAGLWNEGKAVFSDWKFLDFLWNQKYVRGYKPTQPINYNHQIHVEKNQIECQYCHSGVTKSSFATIPSVELCMGCHKSVRTDTEEIKKLKSFFDKKQPVPWVSVNNLPEHVRFNHKRHLKAGVSCQNCHGQVQKMEVVERVSSFKMGFCVSCHRDKGASIDCATCHY